MKRMNLGCGSIQPEGWDNVDLKDAPFVLDVQTPPDRNGTIWAFRETARSYPHRESWIMADYDYIVCNHMLSDIGHHDLVPALKNTRSMLREGGVLRILVPDMERAIAAWEVEQEEFFPQDERTGGLAAKFCTFVTWFGESRSVFVYEYLVELLTKAGLTLITQPLRCGQSWLTPGSEITDLDDRCTEALIVEARR